MMFWSMFLICEPIMGHIDASWNNQMGVIVMSILKLHLGLCKLFKVDRNSIAPFSFSVCIKVDESLPLTAVGFTVQYAEVSRIF